MIDKTINNYRIISKIGEGGMGIVYLAEHLTIKRKAAIKELNPLLSQNEQIKKRFVNEAVALSQLNHQTIIALYDFISQNDRLYLIMEYAKGLTLSQIIVKNGMISEVSAVNILKEILNGFNYAHFKGIIHRDIKPSNIIVDSSVSPKILDFGIAKIIDNNLKISKTGMKVGSVLYMSPEQILGKEVDFRTDIYSLGVTLFEMLSGKFPFDVNTGSEYEIKSKIVNGNFKLIKSINPLISERIQNSIIIATDKNPENRFRSCIEFKNYIDGSFKGKNIIQRKTDKTTAIDGTSSVFISGKKKYISLLYLILIIFIIVLMFGIYLILNYSKEEKSNKEYSKEINAITEYDKKINSRTELETNRLVDINLEGHHTGYADRFGYDPMEMWITSDVNGNLQGSTTIKFSNGKTGTSGFEGVFYSSSGKISLFEIRQSSGSGTIEGNVEGDDLYIYINAVFTRSSDGGKYNWYLKKSK